ncbi:MAG: dienelactone hydrolase family protein [Myxococcota bacterium]
MAGSLLACQGDALEPSAPGDTSPPAPPSSRFDAYHGAETGSFAVTSHDLVIEDPTRGRPVPLRVVAPEGDGSFPVVVFSHGVWGSRDHYTAFVTHWASHGYVSLLPEHDDPVAEDGEGNPFSEWQARVDDVRLVLETIDDIGAYVPALAGRLDPTRVGVAGHSFGAHTAQLLVGTRIFVAPGQEAESRRDPRIAAAFLLAPQGRNAQLGDQAWDDVDLPFMSMTGSRDYGRTHLGEDVVWRFDPFLLAASDTKYLAFIFGAWNDFGGATGTLLRDHVEAQRQREAPGAGDDPSVVRYALGTSHAFWDAHLRQDDTAREYLTTGVLERRTAGEARTIDDPADAAPIIDALTD